MNTNSQTCEQHTTVTIWEIDRDRLTAMQHKRSDTPKLLCVTAGRTTCSIFRVPQTFLDINGKSYQPNIVSVGPFHHGQPQFRMMEEQKWRFLHQLLNRTEAKGIVLEDYLKAVQRLESTARECYSETISYSTNEFVEMMVLDGCFVIELLRKLGGVVQFDEHDPLFTMSWIISFFLRDLIRLENQIPFCVLECLFDLTKTPGSPTLATLALGFFDYGFQRPENVLQKYSETKAKHLLDLLRMTLLPPEVLEQTTKHDNHPPSHIIQNISKLQHAGIRLKRRDFESFLAVKYKNGVIQMPMISIDDFTCAFLLNAVAFEQCHSGSSKHFTAYVTLLYCLINTSKDVGLLCDWDIIENNLGTDGEVASFINNAGKDISFNIDNCYLTTVFDNVNQHYLSWQAQWVGFRHKYFNERWSFVSALAASILLFLTIAQTVYTILGYVSPP